MARSPSGAALAAIGSALFGVLGVAVVVSPEGKTIGLGYVAVASLTLLVLSIAVRNARRAVDRERLNGEAELRAQDARFRALVQNASDVITVIDADGRLQYVSSAASQAWGEPSHDCEGGLLLDRVHADDLLAARHLLNTTLEQPGATATTRPSSEAQRALLAALRDCRHQPA